MLGALGIRLLPLDEGLLELLDTTAGRAIFGGLDGVGGMMRTIPKVLRQVAPIHHRLAGHRKSGTPTKLGAATTSEFRYGSGGRYLRNDQAGASTRTTRYLGSVERITNSGSQRQELRRTIGGFLIISEERLTPATPSTHRRHLAPAAGRELSSPSQRGRDRLRG